ncbi:MAG: hypothetical protein R2814_12270 [Flavobacteriaceae bacterium]
MLHRYRGGRGATNGKSTDIFQKWAVEKFSARFMLTVGLKFVAVIRPQDNPAEPKVNFLRRISVRKSASNEI